MPIRLIQAESFDPETTRVLGLAYDRACEFVPPDVTVREELARRIIQAARRGRAQYREADRIWSWKKLSGSKRGYAGNLT